VLAVEAVLENGVALLEGIDDLAGVAGMAGREHDQLEPLFQLP
jgi:hypothetical protein